MNNSYLYLLRISWKYAVNEHGRYVIIYSLFLFSNIFFSLRPIIYGMFVNQLQTKGILVLNETWLYVSLYMGLFGLQWLVHGPARIMERILAFNIGRNFLEDIHKKIIYFPIDWHKSNHTGSTLNRLKKSSAALRDFFQNGFLYIQTIIQLVISVIAMVYFSPLFGMIAALIGLFTIMTIFLFDKPLLGSLQEVNEHDHKLSSTLSDGLTNIVTVITLRLQNQMQKAISKRVIEMFVPFKRNVTIGERKWFTAGLLVNFIYCIMVIGYVYQNYKQGGNFPIGGLVALVGFVNQFTNVFFSIALQYNQIIQYHADVKSAATIYNSNSDHETHLSDDDSFSWKIFEVKRLNFSYASFNENNEVVGYPNRLQIINNSFCIGLGDKIALTGASGSGKSTLLAVVKGLYQPKENFQLFANGIELSNWGQISNESALFPQAPEIFENTIYYNITMGLPYSEKEVVTACDAACFTEVVNNLAEGFNTIIKENGVNLSGGQKQRLALARGILAAKQRNIILMDESTSSVDEETEGQIYQNLFKLFNDKTIICSIHRLRLLPLFNKKFIMNEGLLTVENLNFY